MTKRILVVDDKPNVVKSCAKMLELEGFETQGITRGSEAIERYKSEDFDLALVDLKMPDVDGLEVLTALKEYDPAATVVIFTAYGTKKHAIEALRLGASEFLEKPLKTNTLIATVRRLLEQEDSGKAVRGSLSMLSLPSIVQINCEERNEARLRLKHRGQEGNIYFAEGNVVHAELGSQTGEEAVYGLLSWENGTFELEMGVSTPERTIEVGWSGLLLEGMRRIDERAAGDRPHCPECGGFLDAQGQCNNPGCPRFTGAADGWNGAGLEQLIEEATTEHMEVNEMANLQDVLKEMAADIPGFVSADVVGMDGLSIAGHAADPDFDAEAAAAQFALVMKLVEKAAGQLGAHEVEDNLVTTNDDYILTRFLGDGSYYLGVAVEKESGSLGNIRLMARNYSDDLWKAIPK